MLQKKCLVFLFEAVADGDVNNSPSALWLQKKHPEIAFTFIMRGAISSDSHLGFYDSSTKTLGFLKGMIFSPAFRRKVRNVQQYLDKQIELHDQVWIRGPGIIPLYHGVKTVIKDEVAKKNKVVMVHLCANRLNLAYLLGHFTLSNLSKFVSGLIALYFVKKIIPLTNQFFFTGSHVKHNFNLPDDSKYLIDTDIKDQGAQARSKNVIFLGRIEKLTNFTHELFELKKRGVFVEAFGSDFSMVPDGCVRKGGYIAPSDVLTTLAQYKICLCWSTEYYEGFPRVILEALASGCIVLVNKGAVFENDVKHLSGINVMDELLPNTVIDHLNSYNNDAARQGFLVLEHFSQKVI